MIPMEITNIPPPPVCIFPIPQSLSRAISFSLLISLVFPFSLSPTQEGGNDISQMSLVQTHKEHLCFHKGLPSLLLNFTGWIGKGAGSVEKWLLLLRGRLGEQRSAAGVVKSCC